MTPTFLLIFLFTIILQIKTVKNENLKFHDYIFWNENLPLEKRLDDLMMRLTLQEMFDQMANGGGVPDKPAPGIERLGIPPYNFDTECLRGIAGLNSTTFPMPINMAATFSTDLAYQVASAVSTEARGIFNEAFARGDYGDMKGLNCFAPFANMVRHPLWGRSQESFGEDPFLIGSMVENYVKGLQGKDTSNNDSTPIKGRYIRAIAGCKHFIVHSGPENIPSSRFSFNAKVSLNDFLLSYLPALQQCIKAGAQNLMCSYNSLNGIPTCASSPLLTSLLRHHLGFQGFVVSDMGAIENIYTGHNYTTGLKEAGIMAAKAGVDLNLHGSSVNAFDYLREGVEEGSLAISTIVNAVRRLFRARFMLGLFDPPSLNPYSNIKKDKVVQSPYHRDLAIQVAVRSVVMLKHIKRTLPVNTFGRLSMIGPMCDNLKGQQGGYSPTIMPQYSSTPYQSLKQHAVTATLEQGCDDNNCNNYNQSAVVKATEHAEFIVVCLGTGFGIEGEDRDRVSLKLPGHQEQLLSDVISHAKFPIVLLTFSGCPLDLTRAESSTKVSSILHCFYPGQSAGEAIRRIMVIGGTFKSNDGVVSSTNGVVSPSGRLPFTWPASLDQLPPMTDYSMKNRTYRYSTTQPSYPFAYGLSYTSFLYSDLSITPSIIPCTTNEYGNNSINNVNGNIKFEKNDFNIKDHINNNHFNNNDNNNNNIHFNNNNDNNVNNINNNNCLHNDDLQIRVKVKNNGGYDAQEVVQVYISWRNLPPNVEMPRLQLVAFQRTVHLTATTAVNVVMRIKLSQLRVLNEENLFIYFPGLIDVFVGGQQPHTTTKTPSNILHSTISLTHP